VIKIFFSSVRWLHRRDRRGLWAISAFVVISSTPYLRGSSGLPGNFFRGVRQNFFWRGGSTNSLEDRGQRERGSGGGSSLVSVSTQFANE
jgi:hypothetical protein